MSYKELKEQMIQKGFSKGFVAWWVGNQMHCFGVVSEWNSVHEKVLGNYSALLVAHKELYLN